MASVSRTRGPIHLGLDVHKDSISVAILHHGKEAPDVERIFHDEASVRRLVGRLGDPRNIRACYEAGPTGYELHRLLSTQVNDSRRKSHWRNLRSSGAPAAVCSHSSALRS